MAVPIASSNNGQTVPIKVGDTAELRLPENSSSGHRWAIEAIDQAHLTVSETGFHGSAGAGSGGDAFWRLLATAAGQTTLSLKRWRSFEGDRSIVERFSVTLRITE
jgi:inhibitor of cysteine peptidase